MMLVTKTSDQTRQCVCVCVCVFSSHYLFWTSSSLDVPAGVTQEEGHTGFLIHLPSTVRALTFLARIIQPFLSLVDREVELCSLMIEGCRKQEISPHPRFSSIHVNGYTFEKKKMRYNVSTNWEPP